MMPLDDAQRFPLINEAGERLLKWMSEHPHAPRYNWRTGDRLDADGLRAVRAFEASLHATPSVSTTPPRWVEPFIAMCQRDVPFYRQRRAAGVALAVQPVLHREAIRAQPWAFVPDTVPIESLICYSTSGTTGTRIDYLATAELPSKYLPLIGVALAEHGVRIDDRGGRVAIVHVCAQRGTVVLHSVSSYLDNAGFVKVNLDDADWHDPADAARFLDACDAAVYTGDPFALARLAELPLTTRPRAIVSAAATLSDGQRARLNAHFGCVVIDLYSMNETGPIAYADRTADSHRLFGGTHTFVEVLDGDGVPCPPGSTGEIVVTGGLNRCLPLVRYRTGDFAALDADDRGRPCLRGLYARTPVRFRAVSGRSFNSVDVATELNRSPLALIEVCQRPDGSVRLTHAGPDDAVADAVDALHSLFGTETRIDSCRDDDAGFRHKRVQYRTEVVLDRED